MDKDLAHIFAFAEQDLREIAGKRLFLTGGTGFFGIWLLETICYVNDNHNLGIEVVVLSRNPHALKESAPHLLNSDHISFVTGDIRDFGFPAGDFDVIVHGATTTARETFNNEDSLRKFDTVALGTRRMLEFALSCRPDKILYLGSGACYGKQPDELKKIPESYAGAPTPDMPNAALGIGKRTAEFFCQHYGEKHELDIKIARCFTLYGPHLPLDIHYAIGNFIADGIAGRDIEVMGDGTQERSYLYIADLVIWLFRILGSGRRLTPYNVGSGDSVTIAQLAATVADYFNTGVKVRGTPTPGAIPNRYVPDVSLVTSELGLEARISLEEGLARMISFTTVSSAAS